MGKHLYKSGNTEGKRFTKCTITERVCAHRVFMKLTVIQEVKKSAAIMDPEGSLPHT
jgi:hypothetical protein